MFVELNESTIAGTRLGRLGLAAALAVSALAAAPAALAADATPGMRAFKDQTTGELRAPTAAEAAVLDSAARGNAARVQPRGLITNTVNPQEIRSANGMVRRELDESTLSYSMATRNTDGTTDLVCVTGPQAAAEVMKGSKAGKQLVKAAKEDSHDHK